MAGDPFSNGGGTNVGIAQFENHNVLIIPQEYLETVKTQNGDKDAVDADIIDLDAEDGPEKEEGVRIFGGVLVGSLKKQAKFNERYPNDPATGFPKMTIGHLIKDVENQKRGQNPAWVLKQVTDEAVLDKARKYVNEYLVAKDPFAPAS
jgi:hypothetical protein